MTIQWSGTIPWSGTAPGLDNKDIYLQVWASNCTKLSLLCLQNWLRALLRSNSLHLRWIRTLKRLGCFVLILIHLLNLFCNLFRRLLYSKPAALGSMRGKIFPMKCCLVLVLAWTTFIISGRTTDLIFIL
jgi:hypothetical protein